MHFRPQTQIHGYMTAHAFAFTAIDGPDLSLRVFAGKPILIVNTASECGYTPQYAGLQELWERYRDRGLVVVGIPSNDFGEQEPGSDNDIQAFCTSRYGVTFPLTQKEVVLGGNAHPFYRWVARELGEGAAPRWNFHKYLIDGTGNLAGAWPPETDPLDPDIVTAIENVLPSQ